MAVTSWGGDDDVVAVTSWGGDDDVVAVTSWGGGHDDMTSCAGGDIVVWLR